MAVDIFGASRLKEGIRGKRGPAGPAGSIKDLCLWMSKGTLANLQKYEEVACFQLDLSTDLSKKGQEIVSWNSRVLGGPPLTAIHPSHSVITLLNGRKAIEFSKNTYTSNFNIIASTPGSGFIAITFQTDSDHMQTLIGRHRKKDRLHQNFEINVTINEIFVSGYQSGKIVEIPIMKNCRKWTTFFLQYTITPFRQIHFEYMIDADIDHKGQFTFELSRGSRPKVTLGSREDFSQPFSGKIAGVEAYFTENSKERIPDELALLVSRNQKIKDDGIVPRDPDLDIYTSDSEN